MVKTNQLSMLEFKMKELQRAFSVDRISFGKRFWRTASIQSINFWSSKVNLLRKLINGKGWECLHKLRDLGYGQHTGD